MVQGAPERAGALSWPGPEGTGHEKSGLLDASVKKADQQKMRGPWMLRTVPENGERPPFASWLSRPMHWCRFAKREAGCAQNQ
jgi:hypothetical protein